MHLEELKEEKNWHISKHTSTTEVGATTSTFGYDESMEKYLRATGRDEKELQPIQNEKNLDDMRVTKPSSKWF